MNSPAARALFVDMDGTLVSTDVLWEAFFQAVKAQPWVALLAIGWLMRGRARLKDQLAKRVLIDPSALPYRDDVLAFVRARKADGDTVILATASARAWAEPVAAHLDMFDDVLASDAEHNLKGANKLAAIEAYCSGRGVADWGYVGDAHADLPIWNKANEVFVVAPSAALKQRVPKATAVFGKKPSVLKAALKAMRPHQWVKNVLLWVPLMLAHAYDDSAKVFAALVAFSAFSLTASSVYLFNDMLDVEADRLHPKKKFRPFAAGSLPLLYGPPMVLGLVTTAITLALLFLPLPYLGVLLLYLAVNVAYSASLKSKMLIDVMLLASLYTLRIFAGGVATDLRVSEWLLAFSIFMFTSLAFAKRYVELARVAAEGKTEAKGRGYRVEDLELIISVGPTAGYLAVLVFALYINNGLPGFYVNKSLLWLTCPLLLYWISRLWFLAKRGELDHDPVVFAVTDKASLAVGVGVGLLLLLAAPPW
ncbi:MAG: UbiA family prenyltransferase [Nannocystaceae bacterium]|nr:UbiA family prenyltransferase [bacterium]